MTGERSPLSRVLAIAKLFVTAYRDHWFAAPVALLASSVSTLGTAVLFVLVSPIHRPALGHAWSNVLDAIAAPLTAYAIYLLVYYAVMCRAEARRARAARGAAGATTIANWRAVVAYDYLAHLPADACLLTLAGTMQFALQSGGMPAWGAILASQLGDDIATFLKEPAVWAGAKGIAGWEERSGKTLGRSIVARLAPRRGEQRDASAGTPASGGIRPQGADVRGRHRAGSADSGHNDGHGDA